MPNTADPMVVITENREVGVPIWEDAKRIREYLRAAAERPSAVKITYDFCTVSGDVLCILAGISPLDILTTETSQESDSSNDNHWLLSTPQKDDAPIVLCQRLKHESTDDKKRWVIVTQILTKNRCFRKYLYRFKGESERQKMWKTYFSTPL